MDDESTGIALGIATLAGVGGLLYLGHRASKAEEARRDQFGWTLDEVRTELFSRYDDDSDGGLTWTVGQTDAGQGEAYLTYVDSKERYYGGLEAALGVRRIRERMVVSSLAHVTAKADVDQDGFASRAELDVLVRAFDADQDGRLSRAERALALNDLKPRYVRAYSREAGLDQGDLKAAIERMTRPRRSNP